MLLYTDQNCASPPEVIGVHWQSDVVAVSNQQDDAAIDSLESMRADIQPQPLHQPMRHQPQPRKLSEHRTAVSSLTTGRSHESREFLLKDPSLAHNILGKIVGIRETPSYGRELAKGTTWRAVARNASACGKPRRGDGA